MSIRVMSAVWDIDLPDSEKLVALALADWCNDDGECWPSVPQIAKKCSKSVRTVQATLNALELKGVLERAPVAGKGTFYRLTPAAAAPRNECTPAESAPVQRTTHTPAAAAPNTSVTIISSEAKASSDKRTARKPDDFPKPDWADRQVWSDFLQNRKRKRLNNTATAYRGFMQDIERLADCEWPPGRLLEHAAAKGWGGIYDPRNQDTRHGTGSRQIQSTGRDGRVMGRTEAAARAALQNLTGTGNPGTGGQTRAAIDGGDHGRVVALPDPDRPLRHVAGR